MTFGELSAALAARGLIAENQLSNVSGAEATPAAWYVQVMMGACAWLAGLFLLAFVVIGFETAIFHGHVNWSMVLVLGITGCAVAALVYMAASATSSFASQFGLAMSCAGQAAIALSVGELSGARTALWIMVFLEAALIFAMQNRLHRALSSFGAVVAWALATHEILFRELPSIEWRAGQTGLYQTSALSVLLWVAVWAPVAGCAYWLAAHEAQWMAAGRESLLRPVTHGLIAALAIAPLATHPATFWLALGLGSSQVMTDGSPGATALWPLLSMGLDLLALALAFNLRNRALMGVAIIFGLLEISGFYYVLGTTLLVKSVTMLVLGAVLLLSARRLGMESR